MRGPANAVSSCFLLAQKLCADKAFGQSVNDPDLRRIITLYLSAGGSDNTDAHLRIPEAERASAAWLEALAAAGVTHDFDPARLSMIAYGARRWHDCLRTIAMLPVGDPLRSLLASRCNLRLTSDLKASRRLLEPTTHAKAMDELQRFEGPNKAVGGEENLVVFMEFGDQSELSFRASAELGICALHLGDFPEALRHFLEAGFEEEADYVAECLLTTPELEAFVAQGMKTKGFGGRFGPDHIRLLLASRLFRAGRLEEALEHTPDDLAPKARTFVLLCRLAERNDVAHRTRADAYWRAALIIGDIGERTLRSPFGLNWTPDGYYRDQDSNWNVPYDLLPHLRLNKKDKDEQVHRHLLIGPGKEEIRRINLWLDAHILKPVRMERDARYATFDLALKAARLLPDNDPAGGMILQYAGSLLKYREPKAANPAYTLLVTHFKDTPYGAEALKRHWFARDRPEPDPNIISK
jgi:tetratricopeptide (TPR) repeat protein